VAATPAAKGTNWAYLSSGTWSLIGTETKGPVINDITLENNFTNEAGVYNTNRLIKNVMGLWLIQRCRKKWMDDDRKDISYPALVKEAEKAKGFKAFVDPNDQSFYSTPDMPGAINAFLKKTGQKPLKNRGEIIRCVMESLAFEYRASIEVLGKLMGRKIDVLHILGGGSQNGPLCQYTADACGIKVVAGPVEATALGNIVVQAIVSKEIKDLEQAREFVKNSFPLKSYQPANDQGWDENYSKFLSLKKA
jgi:sugar (pentulose or hexulose) kinase